MMPLVYLDSYYKTGTGHEIGDDYALTHRHGKMSMAIITDGCSSCKDSDIGARILTLIAKSTLVELYDCGKLDPHHLEGSIRDIKDRIVTQMMISMDIFRIDYKALSSTLLMAVNISDGHTFFIGWGDGYFVERRPSGTTIHEVKFKSGAPFYLSYYLNGDEDYLAQYKRTYGNKLVQVTDHTFLLDGTQDRVQKLYSPNEYFYFKEVRVGEEPVHLSVVSDGCDTFQANYTSKKEKHRPGRRLQR
jgi:hypothetical protein